MINGRNVGGIAREQDAPYQSLDSADVDFGFRVGNDITQPLQTVDICKCLGADYLGGGELVLGLGAEGAAVNNKANPPEALR